jgi:hypothetical protein
VSRFLTPTLALLVTFTSLIALTACGAPPQKMVAVTKDDGVPANSASEERLASDRKPKTTSAPAEDPTQPLTTPLSGESAPSAAGAAGTPAAGKGGTKGPTKGPVAKDPPAPKGGGGKVSKAECKATFDRYIDLTIGSDSRFEGIPPEMIAQLKEQALSQASQKGGDPCSTEEVTRTKYNCAMTAPTTAAWQRCMK